MRTVDAPVFLQVGQHGDALQSLAQSHLRPKAGDQTRLHEEETILDKKTGKEDVVLVKTGTKKHTGIVQACTRNTHENPEEHVHLSPSSCLLYTSDAADE